jgi:DNA replication and repair protein RecF
MPWLDTLTLQHFRLFKHASFQFDSPVVAITGPNGSGKSTVLEAVCLLSQAHSYRTSRERELIQFGKPEARVSLTLKPPVTQTGQNLTVESAIIDPITLAAQLRLTADDRLVTRFTRNEVTLRTRSAVLGHCPSVSFFLSDLDIARASAEARRQWLDAAVAQCDPAHARLLADYDKVRRQKSQLLKQPDTPGFTDQLRLWNEQLQRYAMPILQQRWQYLRTVWPLVQTAYTELAPGLETLTLAYVARWWDENEPLAFDHPPDWSAMLYDAQHRLFKAELARQTCLVGPHRDDVALWLDGHLVADFGSQGQQRSTVLALKHAEWQHLVNYLNDWPVLLLDDVMAELDPKRQHFLLQWFNPQAQVLMTTTHLDVDLGPVQMLDMGIFNPTINS